MKQLFVIPSSSWFSGHFFSYLSVFVDLILFFVFSPVCFSFLWLPFHCSRFLKLKNVLTMHAMSELRFAKEERRKGRMGGESERIMICNEEGRGKLALQLQPISQADHSTGEKMPEGTLLIRRLKREEGWRN